MNKTDFYNSLIPEYKAQYTRTCGKTIEVKISRGWMYVTNKTHSASYRAKELPTMIARLKTRPDFSPTKSPNSPKDGYMLLCEKHGVQGKNI